MALFDVVRRTDFLLGREVRFVLLRVAEARRAVDLVAVVFRAELLRAVDLVAAVFRAVDARRVLERCTVLLRAVEVRRVVERVDGLRFVVVDLRVGELVVVDLRAGELFVVDLRVVLFVEEARRLLETDGCRDEPFLRAGLLALERLVVRLC